MRAVLMVQNRFDDTNIIIDTMCIRWERYNIEKNPNNLGQVVVELTNDCDYVSKHAVRQDMWEKWCKLHASDNIVNLNDFGIFTKTTKATNILD